MIWTAESFKYLENKSSMEVTIVFKTTRSNTPFEKTEII